MSAVDRAALDGHVCDPPGTCERADFCRAADRAAGGCGHLHDKLWPDCSSPPRCWACGRFLHLDRWGQAVSHVLGFEEPELCCEEFTAVARLAIEEVNCA